MASGGIFGGFGQTQQTQQPQQSLSLFGTLGQSTQNQQQGGGISSGLSSDQRNQTSQFGNSQLGAFGQNNQPQQQNSTTFGQSQPSQQLQPLLQLGKSGIWQPNSSLSPQERSVPEQMEAVLEKWNSLSPNCAFKYYFYNKVDDNMAPYYRPGVNEDPKAWNEALSKKPDKGYIPVLCVGFAQIGERIKLQQRNLANFNARLHEINSSLSQMMRDHETRNSIKALDARRKHVVLKQRCLALATKVQVLKNRGYALGGDEEDLKIKLLALERQVNDPALGARGEEIWARMVAVQERAKVLNQETRKAGLEVTNPMDEEFTRRAKKILEDYHTQLVHLSSELDSIKQDYEEWLKDPTNPKPNLGKDGPPNPNLSRPLNFM
ncbi:Nucleoporin NUP57 [Golovinomyces cichoracearum]|uniref:Nucleoporin NUP57 n=1 Tax=Golovinomyces cichoracearum TaxID=62708 RepID=A0A420IGY3_9PEZI|nr:Nucleoporin NUP57 [Golovinomyces cichoracearum]